MNKVAFVTGITGQDGSYLAELLLSKGYKVHGLIRRSSSHNTSRIAHLIDLPNLTLHFGELTDSEQLNNIIYNVQPDEIYHLGAQSHVRVSFDIPEYTGNVTGLGVLRILEAIRRSDSDAKFYQASSSELFGDTPPPQNEESPFRPRSPYACAKLYAYWTVKNYRDGYGIFASNGILFNHESPRRGETFVTRKITKGIADILSKRLTSLKLGNLDAKRDWGYAPEYVDGMWQILQQDKADDFVLGTGETHSVREFAIKAFEYAGLDIDKYVDIDPKLYRPTEVESLVADITKAKKVFGWNPKIKFDNLVKIMVDHDLTLAGLEAPCEGLKFVMNLK